MKEYQPWDDSWREQIVYIIVPREAEMPVEMSADFAYPLFLGAFEKRVSNNDFWQAVAGAMVFVIGHQPDHEQSSAFVHWLNEFRPSLVKELMYDGVDQASHGNLETAIWLFQAAVLLNPDVAETHFNLGLAYYQLGRRLNAEGERQKGDSALLQAVRYMENTLELDPRFSLAYFNLGDIYKQMGKKKESQECLEKSVLLGLENIEAGRQEGSRNHFKNREI